MEIELRRVAYNPRLDEHSFAANVFIGGEKAAVANKKNDRLVYYAIDERGAELVEQAEQFLKKQPGEKKLVDGVEKTVIDHLGDKIQILFNEYLLDLERKKFDKKVQLVQKRNIVIGDPGRYMRTVSVNAQIDLLVKGNNKELIKEVLIQKVIPDLSIKELILNTNIPEAIFKEAGLKPEQYQIGDGQKEVKKTNKKSTGIKP